jgi:hypothetical protein
LFLVVLELRPGQIIQIIQGIRDLALPLVGQGDAARGAAGRRQRSASA